MPPPQPSGRLAGALVTVVVGAAVVLGVTALLHVTAAGTQPRLRATAVTTASGTRAFDLNIATYPDSLAGEHGKGGGAHPDWVSYGPTTNYWVPAHALVRVTIRNYDGATPLVNPYFAQVQGTVGGVAFVNGKPLRRLNPNDVAHTFTIHMFPTAGQPQLDVSVPLLGTPDNAPNLASGYPKPEVITFSFRTGAAGRYIWQCNDPCGTRFNGFGGPMSTLGYMDGTITVGGSSHA